MRSHAEHGVICFTLSYIQNKERLSCKRGACGLPCHGLVLVPCRVLCNGHALWFASHALRVPCAMLKARAVELQLGIRI